MSAISVEFGDDVTDRGRYSSIAGTIGLVLVLPAATLSAQSGLGTTYDRVILGGQVMDPASGLDAVRNIGLLDGRIAVITTAALRGRDTVDARGLVVAPGFIDLHAHGQTPETYRFQSLDGVTTSLELELGTADVGAWYRQRSAGERINYGVSIGHIKVRMAVMHDSGTVMPVSEGAYRAASPAQIREIVKSIETGLSEGAVSIGAGFPYTPAATRDELLAVFRVAARTRTSLHVHIRPGVAGLRDALSLASETNAPLHVVHINSAALAETPVMLEMIKTARARGHDVTTEAYPYSAGMTEIQSATIQDIYRTAPDERLAELEWPPTGERLNRETFQRYSRSGGPVVVHTNTEQMVTAAITSPLTIIASDAYWQNGRGHPRTTGTFSKVLGRYVREAHSLSLMHALRKMTLMPAQRLERRVPAMRNKGRLRVGADADITIFDAATVMDRSTYREPSLPPVGIQHVIVNGVSVVASGRAVDGVAPGRPVRAPISAAMPPRAESYADSLAVIETLGAALREDARTVIQRFACHDGMHPCRTPEAVLPDPLLAAFAERAGARLVNDVRASIPPCPWGWENPATRPGYRIGVARLTLSGDTARMLILKHCDNVPGRLHDIFGQDDEYTLTRDASGSWGVRAQKMTRITRARDHCDVGHLVLDSWRCRGASAARAR